ncbi:glycosyltransferase family 4 protein [Lacticaseibacillus paracasei]|uniref:glycosyltransferase family 4 protein n=1 Tax=Lacticaseibacillus paracasei TaxID=1597 RepID=UPI00338F1E56
MKVAFVLPPFSSNPIGGYQMVYKYANQLVSKGWQVDIYYLAERFMVKPKVFADVKMIVKKVVERFDPDRIKLKWFSLNPSISEYFHQASSIQQPYDAMIATAVQTAKFVADQGPDQGEKFYFIQALEKWVDGGQDEAIKSFHLPLHKVVVAKWLEQLVFENTGERSYIIPNSIDTSEFYPSYPMKGRRNRVALLNHILPEKNSGFGVSVLKEVKKRIPDLEVLMFGVPTKPSDLPDYFHYFQSANTSQLREQIYGPAKIYLLPPKIEGWGLTGMEAMACGTALVASDVVGIKEYATDQENAFLLPVDDKTAFVNTVVKLLKNESACMNIANRGLHDTQNFSLDKSTDAWIALIEKLQVRA